MGKIRVPSSLSWLVQAKCFRAVSGPWQVEMMTAVSGFPMWESGPSLVPSSATWCSAQPRAAQISTEGILRWPGVDLNVWSILTMLLLMTFVPRVVLQYGAEETNLGPYQQLEVNRGMDGSSFWASQVMLVESACQCNRNKRRGFDPCVKKIPWRKKWQPVAIFLPGKCYRQRSLAGCNPLGRRVIHGWAQHWACLMFIEYVSSKRAFGVFKERTDWIVEKVSET